ncbi:LysR family transcriptional regulator [Kiloniella sp.]|uniref:LysR family transcriptional regulator n=1 Tax=Kiloniella sp. TaxID=1938587 RepID=UPI003B01D4F8
MDWDDAKYFLAIAREGQMLGAAKRLKVSQAKLSRRITSLEEAIGTRLLDRSTSGCRLTENGAAMFETAEKIEAEFLQGLSRLKRSDSEISGTIRIGAPDGFGVAFLAPRLSRFTQAFPQLNIQLVPVSRYFSLSQREADIAIMIGRPDKGRLRVKRLSDYSLGLYAARSYLEKAGHPNSLADIKDHTLIGYVEDLIYTPALNYSSEFLRDWRSTIEVSTAMGQFEAVRSGAGIGILHDFMAISNPDLIPLFPEHFITRQYWTVWHEDMRIAKRVSAVADLLDRLVLESKSCFIR